MHARVTRFDATGKLASVRPARPERGFAPGNRPTPYRYVCGASGTQAVVGWPAIDPPQSVGPYRGTVEIAAARPGQAFVRVGDVFPGPERYRHESADGPLLFGKGVYVTVSQSAVFVGAADSFVVAVYNLTGARVGTIRHATTLKPITADDRAAYKARELERLPAIMDRAAFAQAVDEAYLPPTMPAYQNMLVDDRGRVWIQEGHRPTERTRRWWGFTETGAAIGSLEVPAAFALYEITTSTALGRWTDTNGAESVRRYQLVRTAR
jgi:hypothetical protein